ncbi:MAG TPA: hypothetical protein ACQGQH_00105 [Xylella sp.]
MPQGENPGTIIAFYRFFAVRSRIRSVLATDVVSLESKGYLPDVAFTIAVVLGQQARYVRVEISLKLERASYPELFCLQQPSFFLQCLGCS